MNHFIRKCTCGTVIAQCRCPAVDKVVEIVRDGCGNCRPKELDTEFTEEVVCPHCGYVHTDSWEFPDEANKNCGECGKRFSFIRHTTVAYSSHKEEL